MAELTPHEIDVVNEFQADLDSLMQDRLEHIGVQVSKQHFTGDNSFPTEYVVRYSFVRGMGPTLDMAIADFVEKLLKHVPVEKALEKPETSYLGEPVEPGWLGD
jgi:hypothetical protein